mgnify:FL=1
MKGFNLSTGITLTSFGGWKSDTEKESSNKGLRGLFNRLKKNRSKKKDESVEATSSLESAE